MVWRSAVDRDAVGAQCFQYALVRWAIVITRTDMQLVQFDVIHTGAAQVEAASAEQQAGAE
jgi:hypothetical protein